MDYKQSIDGGLRELALFAGAGGGILGGKLLGWRTVCAVEIEPYPTSVLCARQNDGILSPFPIWDDVSTFDGKPWRGRVDVVSGGFPCQDISAAGKGAGIENGERSGLWREFARIIREVRPRYVFVENSPMLVSRGLGIVLGDLAALGYAAEWGVLGACDVGAPHKRKRIWIVAYTGMYGLSPAEEQGSTSSRGDSSKAEQEQTGQSSGLCTARIYEDVADTLRFGGKAGVADTKRREEGDATELINGGCVCNTTSAGLQDGGGGAVGGQEEEQKLERSGGEFGAEAVADTYDAGLQGGVGKREAGAEGKPDGYFAECGGDAVAYTESGVFENGGTWRGSEGDDCGGGEQNWWAVEPDVGRVAHGVAARVDRLKAIGNGQVPTVAATAFRILTNQ